MLKILRRKGVAKKILWVITGFIIISFALWGKYSVIQDQAREKYAGKIFGQKISIEQYQHSLEMSRLQAMMQYGQEFDKVSQFLNLQAQAWDRLIILHEANHRRIKVNDAEVIQAIGSYPLFQRDGKIDSLRYNDLLRYVFHMRPRDFEEGTRDNLKITKMLTEETADLYVSEDEAFKHFKQEREKIQISYVLFADDSYKNQVPLDEEKIKEYYKTNLDAFTLPLMINVEYVRFDVPLTKKQTDKNEKDKPDAKTPETEPAQDADQKAAMLKNALNFFDEARQTKDFDQTAKKYNLPVLESGLFSMEQPNLKSGWSFPIVQKIFNLQENDVNGPVETSEGYQILKIKEKKASYTLSYEEAKDKAKEAWLKAEARKIAKQKAEEYLPEIRKQNQTVKNPDFAKIVKGFGLEPEQTPVFGRGQYLPKIGISRDFQDKAFALNLKNTISTKIAETVKGYCILHLDSRVPVNKEDFQKEKSKVTAEVLEQKRNETINDFLTRLRLKSGLEDHVPELMKQ